MSSPARSKERDALLDTPDGMAVVGRCVCVCACVVEEAIRAVKLIPIPLLKISMVR